MPQEVADTLQEVLDVAEEMIQTRGYNAVSFREIAGRVGIKSASIHYYFKSKGDLGAVLVKRYADRFGEARRRLEGTPSERLMGFAKFLSDGFRASGRMCLCGVLAAETSTLPAKVTREVREFFDQNERWLAGVLQAGRESGRMRFEGPPADAAKALFAAIEGALMSAWIFRDEARLGSSLSWVIRSVSA